MANKNTERRPLRLRDFPVWIALTRILSQKGVSPNTISAIGLAAGFAAGLALAATAVVEPGWTRSLVWILGILMVQLRGACNILDGVLAVETGVASPIGLLWNEVPDRVSDACIFIGAGYAVGGAPVAGWAAALVAVFVAYVRVQSRLAGAPMDYRGPMAKPMRMVVVCVAAFYLAVTPAAWQPAWGPDGRYGLMSAALLLVIAGGIITAFRRLRYASIELRMGTS